MNRLCLLACLFAVAASVSCSYFKGKPPEPVFRCVVKELPAPGTNVMVWAMGQKSYYVGPADRNEKMGVVPIPGMNGPECCKWNFSPFPHSPADRL